MKTIDFTKDQFLMSIRCNGTVMGYVNIENGKITTEGRVGNNQYDNFVDLIKGLQGFNIKIDDFFF